MAHKAKYWREHLQRLKQELLEVDAGASESRGAVELDQSKVGRLSRMDAMQAQAMNNAVSARRKNHLQRIEAALARLDNDEFGYCVKCGDDIDIKRLSIDPALTLCTGCLI